MTTEITSHMDDDLDFFDFTDIDPVSVKKNAIASQICTLMAYTQTSRSSLAKKLNWKPSRLTKVLSGEQNLTIKTITEISIALEYDFSVYFHLAYKAERVQPWEVLFKTHLTYPKLKNESDSLKYFTVKIQTPDEIKNDFIKNKGCDYYVSINKHEFINDTKMEVLSLINDKENNKLWSSSDLFSYTPTMVTKNG
ncbi:TPA: helix-turn-helix transcriptional regulator [Proteus mirabilis]|nr:helix-turn-helix transcriptional regulator [Proteus mirabilis]